MWAFSSCRPLPVIPVWVSVGNQYPEANMDLMRFFGFGKPKVAVQVLGEAIVVTLPGTSFVVTYKRCNGGLVAADFSGRDVQRKVTMPEFLAQAWKAANEKARELRWRGRATTAIEGQRRPNSHELGVATSILKN